MSQSAECRGVQLEGEVLPYLENCLFLKTLPLALSVVDKTMKRDDTALILLDMCFLILRQVFNICQGFNSSVSHNLTSLISLDIDCY